MLIDTIGETIRQSTNDLCVLHGEGKTRLDVIEPIILRRTNTSDESLISYINILVLGGWISRIAGGYFVQFYLGIQPEGFSQNLILNRYSNIFNRKMFTIKILNKILRFFSPSSRLL